MSADIEPEGDWYGLYKSGSRDDHLFTTSSTRHPAKMSLALTNKILDTMQEWGWIETGSLVVDPFGGRGTTALCWLARHPANRALTVELEPHFVDMQDRNKEHAERRLHRELAWVILQGDSRRFSEYYAEGKAASVLSAPYGDQAVSQIKSDRGNAYRRGEPGGSANNVEVGYGSTPGQIGNLPDSAITSAPYADSINDSRDPDAKRARKAERYAKGEFTCQRPDVFTSEKNQGAVASIGGHHSDTPGQIGRLKDPPAAAITSAPYADTQLSDKQRGLSAAKKRGELAEWRRQNIHPRSPDTWYGQTPGQIGNLKDPPAASVLSAPYENSITDAKPGIDMSKSKRLASGRKDEGANSQVIIGGYQRDAAVLSAPYAAAENRRAAGKVQQGEVSDAITRAYDATNHGQTAGNIANLPDACVTSAPYGNQQGGGGKQEKSVQEGRLPDSLGAAHRDHREKQSAVGQIANLPDAALLSAPYATANTGGPILQQGGEVRREVYTDPAAAVTSAPFENSLNNRGGITGPHDTTGLMDAGYTDAAAVTSAPCEATPGGGTPSPTGVLDQGVSERHMASRIGKTGGYADNQQGQIGVLQSESYADACGKVYASLAKAGIRFVCSVTKDPVRQKRLRPLRLLTISLFEQAGYRLVAWRRAWLYHTQAELDAMAGQESLFGDEVEESKRLVGRLSFFRRLSLSKGGIASPYEDCLFFELARPDPAVCKHGIPQGQYCAPCDDDYIARQEASPVGQPAQPPRWVQPELS